MKEDNKESEEVDAVKYSFFKKIWYSIDKIEKYSELSAEGFGSAIKYLMILVAVLALIVSIITVVQVGTKVKQIGKYIDEESPNFTYKNNELTVETEEQPIIIENEEIGKIIIDTNQDDEEEINQYIEDIDNGLIILKDRLIIEESSVGTEETYNYQDLLQNVGITEFDKQQLVNYINSNEIISIYLRVFFVMYIYAILLYTINILIDIFAISIVGYVATLITRMKIRYIAVFNMAVYSITLATILQMIYLIINAIFKYDIPYFDVMYVIISSIYMTASIFMIKTDMTKKQAELDRINEVKEEVRKEFEEKGKEKEQKKEEEKKNENKEPGKKDGEEKLEEEENGDKKSEDEGEEPEGSEA